MRKNYSILIKDKEKRILTAKGVKFLWRCVDVMAMQYNLNRYSRQIKTQKEKLRAIIEDLIFDKELSIEGIKDLIKNRNKEKLS